MKKEIVTLSEIKLIGISARTNNNNEMNPATSKIGQVIGQYFHQSSINSIPNLADPEISYSVYTKYENGHHGDYTYFFGQQVGSFDSVPAGYETLTIAPQVYTKFTTNKAAMPGVVIEAWQQIWQMTPKDFGGERRYVADFEIYDQRTKDPSQAIVDIYVGINN